MSTRPGWYPDPSGRYPKRWYDGNDWTASVLNHNAQQSYDQLPPAGAPAVASLPAATAPSAPPPPPGAPPRPPATAAPVTPPPGNGSWQPGQRWDATPSTPTRPYTSSASGGVWPPQQPVTTASLGLTPPPVVGMSSGAGTKAVVYGLVGLGVACLVLSLFVVDWYSEGGQSVGFRDFGDGDILPSAPFLDELTFWNFKWLGFVIAGLALLAVFGFVIAGVGARRGGLVVAAILAAGGALVSTLSIVRFFRTDSFDPDPGAWLLPAGYLVLLAAIVISARNEPG